MGKSVRGGAGANDDIALEFMRHEIEDKKVEILKLQQEVSQLRMSGAIDRGTVDEELSKMLMEYQTQIDGLKSENLDLKNKQIMDKSSGETNTLKKENKQLKEERDRLKKNIEDLHKKLEAAENALREQRYFLWLNILGSMGPARKENMEWALKVSRC